MIPVLLFLGATALLAEPVEYKIVSGGGNMITLEVEKTGLMKGKAHHFEFPNFQGRLTYDPQAPANSKVDLKIEATSMACHDTWVSPKDLQKIMDTALSDMLLVRQYPEMRFTSTKVTPQGGNHFQVDGVLTIRGIAKPITLSATLQPAGMVIDGKSVFKMTSYGMKPPSALLGAIGTKDDMTASFHVTASK
jgi:polyisoprenoid-binding protein YceI